MLDLFAPLKRLLEEEPVRIDNIAFRLHSRFTVLLLLVCAILVTAKQYIGEPITCITDGSIDKEPLNAYCWIYGTFTVSRYSKGIPGQDVVSAGVGQASENDKIYRYHYYQWVCFVLGFQAILFRAPRMLWEMWERGTIKILSKDLSSPFPSDVWTDERKMKLVEYFTKTNLHAHDFYAFRYFVCEVLNFANSTGQMYLLDLLLEGEFSSYGATVLAFATGTEDRRKADPIARLFPKLSKCTIRTFGSAGSIQIHDALCVLPLNVVNEKVFVLLWFWLVFLGSVGAVALIYRFLVFSQSWIRVYLLRGAVRTVDPSKVKRIVQVFRFGDWFILYQLVPNMNPIVYSKLIEELADALSSKKLAEFA